jgi:hypothetical protein
MQKSLLLLLNHKHSWLIEWFNKKKKKTGAEFSFSMYVFARAKKSVSLERILYGGV